MAGPVVTTPAATTAAAASGTDASAIKPTTGKTSGASGMMLPYMIIPLTILYVAPFVIYFIKSQMKKARWIKLWKLNRSVPIPN